MAQKSGEMMKRIVRKVGHDWLPLEVLDSLKRSAAEANVADASGISKPRKNWKPNLKLKRIFSYIHDKDIQPKVSIYSLRSVERTGGTSVYHLKTPYQESWGADKGCLWKGKLDRRYVILKKGVAYLTPEEEAKIVKPRHKPKTTDL